MKRLLPFLILNVVISALTTLLVLTLWDRSHQAQLPAISSPAAVQAGVDANGTPMPQPTLPPLDQEVIQVETVIGAGDLNNEVVVLTRVGDGDLNLMGWRIVDEEGTSFTFPDLILNKNGSVRLYSRAGQSSVIELFWGLKEAIWKNGELLTLLDPLGNTRSAFRIP